jgi:hypothetical protein
MGVFIQQHLNPEIHRIHAFFKKFQRTGRYDDRLSALACFPVFLAAMPEQDVLNLNRYLIRNLFGI